MIGFIATFFTIIINHNSSQSMTVYDSLYSLLDYKCLLFHGDWLGSGLRIGHFFSFHCTLVNTPRLNIKLLNSEFSYEWWMTTHLRMNSLTTQLNESKPSQSQSHIATGDQSVSKSWCRAPSGAHDQIFIVWHNSTCFFVGRPQRR
jgi:hypothetical protein